MRRLTEKQLRDHIDREIKRAGTAKALAAELGFSAQYLGDVLRGRPASVRLVNALGLKRVVRYERLRP